MFARHETNMLEKKCVWRQRENSRPNRIETVETKKNVVKGQKLRGEKQRSFRNGNPVKQLLRCHPMIVQQCNPSIHQIAIKNRIVTNATAKWPNLIRHRSSWLLNCPGLIFLQFCCILNYLKCVPLCCFGFNRQISLAKWFGPKNTLQIAFFDAELQVNNAVYLTFLGFCAVLKPNHCCMK